MRYNASLTKHHDGASRAHVARYAIAKGFITPGDTVIDATCGTGYGSTFISDVAGKVLAYDQVDKLTQTADNVEYTKCDLEKPFEFPECDVSISLETLEHLENPILLVRELQGASRKWFIFSVPLNEEPGGNPFHKQVFTKTSALQMVANPLWAMYHSFMQGNHIIGIMYRI